MYQIPLLGIHNEKEKSSQKELNKADRQDNGKNSKSNQQSCYQMSGEVKLWGDEAIHYDLLIAIGVWSVCPISNWTRDLFHNDHVDKKGRFHLLK